MVTAGQTATFSVAADGTHPLIYQWHRDGAAITGAISSSYTTLPTTSADNGTQFTVTISNKAGALTSNAATLTVTPAPVAPSVTTQPASQTVTSGQTATFSVTASGTVPLSYQWNKNGAALSGATSLSYTTPPETTADNGMQFTVVVSNSAGSITSSAATLTVNAAAVAPSIATQPGSQTVTAGQTATFSVAATGTAPLSYRWSKNGTAIGGATSSSYTTPAETTADNGAQFTVVVSNSAGSVTGNAATLTVNPAPVAPSITTQPSSQTITVGQTATFSVVATGTSPLSYQWQKNGAAISGATSSSYTTPAETTSDNGAQFTVVVSNSAGSVTSNAATLTVNPAPVAPSITTQPSSVTIMAGQTATFSVTATGTAPLSYQWRNNGTTISGATSASYTTPAETTSDNGAQFTVVVSNGVGSVTSSPALLTVSTTLSITTNTLPNAVLGLGYNAPLAAVGGTLPYTWSVSVGSLPAGLTLRSLGLIAGTPTVTGSDSFTVQVTDLTGQTALQALSLTVSTTGLLCGQPDDLLIHIPANWTTFTPPAEGQSYADPAFGCAVTRVTNGSIDETLGDGTHPSLSTYYSTFTAMNATDTLLLVFANDGSWRVRDLAGNVVVPRSNMPAMNGGGHLSWDAFNGNVFYYTLNNALMKGTISGNTVTSSAVHTFTEYSGIVSPDSADLSQDGDHFALMGQNTNSTMDIFVWSFSLQAKTSVYTTACTLSGSITSQGQPGCVHKLQLTADNLLSIQFASDGTGSEQGLRLWSGGTLVHLQDSTSHYDTGYDLSGNSIFAERGNSFSLAGLVNPCPGGWGLDARSLSNLSSSSCLLDNPPSWHVSYRGGPSQPWMAITAFDDRSPGPELYNTNPNFQAPSASNWQLYEDEIILVRVDANNSPTLIYRLAHARSRSVEDYWAQVLGTISRDGRYVVFSSDMAYPNGCASNMHGNECSDVYLIKVQ